jgi:hypothetical protein
MGSFVKECRVDALEEALRAYLLIINFTVWFVTSEETGSASLSHLSLTFDEMSGGYAPANGARGAPVHRVVNADITVGVSFFLGIQHLP